MRPLAGPQAYRREGAAVLSPASFFQPDHIVKSAWLEHAPFLSWLLDALRPGRFVEVGCRRGSSYFIACQAVKSLGLRTSCFGVDGWCDAEPGPGAEGGFDAANDHNGRYYSDFSQLIRASFDEAASLFADGTIDLLHLNGRRLYEEVRDDVANWRPKLSTEAVVLLHDTNVRDRHYGVWKLFDELRREHPTYEFLHGNGLGVVAFGRIPPSLVNLFDVSADRGALLHIAYATLGRAVGQRQLLSQLTLDAARREREQDAGIAEIRQEAEILRRQLAAGEDHRQALRREIEDISAAHAAEMSQLERSLAADHAIEREQAALQAMTLTATIRGLEDRLDAAASRNARAEALLWLHHETIQRLKNADIAHRSAIDSLRHELAAHVAEKDRLLNSETWRVTEPGRRLFRRHPRKMRALLSVARAAWLLATLQFRTMADRARARAQLRRDEAMLAREALFDRSHYREVVAGVASSGWSPIRHFLVRGRHANLNPHPLFDGGWYAREYAEIGVENPFMNYVREGRAKGRKPNALFDPTWYRGAYPEADGLDALHHFMTIGAAKGFDPSPLFKTKFYLTDSPDVAAAGINPLAHYLRDGHREGRQFRGYDVDITLATSVMATPIACRRQPGHSREAALFVTHSPNGRLKPHVRHYLDALRREGVAVTLIVAADRGFTEDDPSLHELVDGLYVRANRGWDFAAWAHVLRLNHQFYGADILYWLNDSVIGPVNRDDFHALLAKVRENQAALVGLTANHERGYHLQSYFLAFKPAALGSAAFRRFVLAIGCFADKEDAINAYEIRLSPLLARAGIATAPVFEPGGPHNPTIYEWKSLLARGFSFLKIMAITHDMRHVDNSDWRETLAAHGYDVLMADQVLAERQVPPMDKAGPEDWEATRAVADVPPRVAFVGPFNYDNGLGVAARGYLSAMMHGRWALNALPLSRPFHIHRRIAPSLRAVEFAGMADIAVVHLNPDSWAPLLDGGQRDAIAHARCLIGAFVWESQTPPADFVEKIVSLSGVWAPSRFCATAFAAVDGVPVHVVPYPVPVRPAVDDPVREQRLRSSIGVTERERLLLYSFDASSYLPRKNPFALLSAFQRSGLVGQGWRLVLKTKHLAAAGADGVALASGMERTAGAVLIDRPMSAEESHALMTLADVYVSPHAAEGFGLTIAEAMAQGKPVVATDFSGSTDFLDDSCGFPVRWSAWRLERDLGPYPAGTAWGRVDEDALAEALLRVAALDPEQRAELGGRARARVEHLLSPAAVAARMRASIDALLGR